MDGSGAVLAIPNARTQKNYNSSERWIKEMGGSHLFFTIRSAMLRACLELAEETSL